MSDEDRDEGGAGSNTYETSVMDFLDKEMSVSSGSVNDTGSQAEDIDILVNRILRQAIAAAEEKGLPASSAPDRLPPAPAVQPAGPGTTLAEKKRDSSFASPAAARVEERHSSAPVPAMSQGEKATLPSPVFAPVVTRRIWQGRVFLVCGASLCLLAGAGIVYLTSTQSKSPAQPAQSVSMPASTLPAKAEASAPPSAAAVSGNPVPGSQAATTRTDSGLRAPVRRESPRPAENPITAPAGSAAPANAPQAAGTQRPGGEVISPAAAEAKPATGEAAAVSAVAEPPAPTPPKAAAPPAPQNETPPAATFAQMNLNTSTGLQDLAAVRKPAIQAPPAPRMATPPTVISKVMPAYPDLAKRTRTWGTVVVDVQIDAQGKPVKAVAESGPAMLHEEAIKAVLRWRFAPATLDGMNVPGSAKVSIVFKNQNGGQL